MMYLIPIVIFIASFSFFTYQTLLDIRVMRVKGALSDNKQPSYRDYMNYSGLIIGWSTLCTLILSSAVLLFSVVYSKKQVEGYYIYNETNGVYCVYTSVEWNEDIRGVCETDEVEIIKRLSEFNSTLK